jgi:anaerobic selenocysteine-containing dehydrogenase
MSKTNREEKDISTGKQSHEENRVQIRKTICDICNPMSHCGIDAHVENGVVIKVEGTKENPHNAGTLCAKGSASRQYIYHKDRLRTPLLNKGSRESADFQPISWEEALDIMAERFTKIKGESGPESVVFYAGYPKWMRPFLKRLAHNFGSPNYCTESSTCATAVKVANLLNYGSFHLPDISEARCLLVWSSNPFYSNTSTVRRLLDARDGGLKIIEVGPLITPLTAHADIHLRIRPGTSGALALGMAHVIIEEELFDLDFVENWTLGFEEYRAYVQEFSPKMTEEITGVPADLIARAARLYATTKPAALLSGMSATVHHTNGLQNHRALSALIGLTGNFDQPGGNYSLPPTWLNQPNGLITRAAEFDQPRPYADMAPRIGENKHPVWCALEPQAQAMELPYQINSSEPYPIRAMIGFGLNHRMWPGSDFMAESLKTLDFLVQVELFMTDTARMCDLVLPACTSFERSELKIYPFPTRFAIWTQPVIEPVGESRSDVEIICDLARRIAPEDELLCSGHESCLDWILEPTGLTIKELANYPAGMSLENIQYPPYRKYEKNGLKTLSGKMEFTSTRLEKAGLDALPTYEEPKCSPVSTPEMAKAYPLILTTGARLPMYVHSRTYRLPWTRMLRPGPSVDIHPVDAEVRHIGPGDWVLLSTPRASMKMRANLTEVVPPGVINAYHGQADVEINHLIDPDYRDPISGFPGFKSLLCQIEKVSAARAGKRKEEI